MNGDVNRYFIELQLKAGPPVPRPRETELRREAAAQFVATVESWLRQHDLNGKVVGMAITALGQVHMICEDQVIGRMRGEDELNILNIRKGAISNDLAHRWSRAQ